MERDWEYMEGCWSLEELAMDAQGEGFKNIFDDVVESLLGNTSFSSSLGKAFRHLLRPTQYSIQRQAFWDEYFTSASIPIITPPTRHEVTLGPICHEANPAICLFPPLRTSST